MLIPRNYLLVYQRRGQRVPVYIFWNNDLCYACLCMLDRKPSEVHFIIEHVCIDNLIFHIDYNVVIVHTCEVVAVNHRLNNMCLLDKIYSLFIKKFSANLQFRINPLIERVSDRKMHLRGGHLSFSHAIHLVNKKSRINAQIYMIVNLSRLCESKIANVLPDLLGELHVRLDETAE